MAATRNGFVFAPSRALQDYLEKRAADLDQLLRQREREFEAKKRAIVAVYARPAAARARALPARPAADLKPSRIAEELRAVGSGLADGASFGAADWLSAGVKTASQAGASDFWRRLKEAHAAEKAQDAYDWTHHGGARLAGQGVGTVASLALGGGVLGAARGASAAAAAGRLAPTVAHVMRLGVPTGVAGGSIGGTVHVGLDVANGVPSRPSDVASAVLAGALGGVVAPYVGPMRAGAVTGAATPVLEGLFKGEAASLPDVLAAAGLGMAAGAGGWALTDKIFKPMNMTQKGKLGETLSYISKAGRLGVPARQKRVYLPGGGFTVADELPRGRVVEVKTGTGAKLSDRQTQARAELANYVVEHWLPRDLTSLQAIALVGLGAPNIEVPDHLKLSAERPPP